MTTEDKKDRKEPLKMQVEKDVEKVNDHHLVTALAVLAEHYQNKIEKSMMMMVDSSEERNQNKSIENDVKTYVIAAISCLESILTITSIPIPTEIYTRVRIAQMLVSYSTPCSETQCRIDSLLSRAQALTSSTNEAIQFRNLIRDTQIRFLMRTMKLNSSSMINKSIIDTIISLCNNAILESLSLETSNKWCVHFSLLLSQVLIDIIQLSYNRPALLSSKASATIQLKSIVKHTLGLLDEVLDKINVWKVLPFEACILIMKCRILWICKTLNSSTFMSNLSANYSSQLIKSLDDLELAASKLEDAAYLEYENSNNMDNKTESTYIGSLMELSMYSYCTATILRVFDSINLGIIKPDVFISQLKQLRDIYINLSKVAQVNDTKINLSANDMDIDAILSEDETNNDDIIRSYASITCKTGLLFVLSSKFDISPLQMNVFTGKQLLVLYKYLVFLSTRNENTNKSLSVLNDALEVLDGRLEYDTERTDVWLLTWKKYSKCLLLRNIAELLISEEKYEKAMQGLIKLDKAYELSKTYLNGNEDENSNQYVFSCTVNMVFMFACQSMGLFKLMNEYEYRVKEALDICSNGNSKYIPTQGLFYKFIMDINSVINSMCNLDCDNMEKIEHMIDEVQTQQQGLLIIFDEFGFSCAIIDSLLLLVKAIFSYINGNYRLAKTLISKVLVYCDDYSLNEFRLISLELAGEIFGSTDSESAIPILIPALALASDMNKTHHIANIKSLLAENYEASMSKDRENLDAYKTLIKDLKEDSDHLFTIGDTNIKAAISEAK